MKVLILGGTRYHGKATADHLRSRGHNVVTLSRSNTCSNLLSHITCDRNNLNQLAQAIDHANPDIVIDNTAYNISQVEGVTGLIRKNTRYIFCSSIVASVTHRLSSTYHQYQDYTVDQFLANVNLSYTHQELRYGMDKWQCEQLVLKMKNGLVLRLHNVVDINDFSGKSQYMLGWIRAMKSLLATQDWIVQFCTAEQVKKVIHDLIGDFPSNNDAAHSVALNPIEIKKFCKLLCDEAPVEKNELIRDLHKWPYPMSIVFPKSEMIPGVTELDSYNECILRLVNESRLARSLENA